MKKNFLNICYPSVPSYYTHYLLDDANYIEADYNSFPPKGKLSFKDKTKILKKDSYVSLIEYGLGFKAAWCKVRVNQQGKELLCYVETILLNPIEEIEKKYSGTTRYPSYTFPINPEKQYQPNDLEPEIDWREQEKNIVYEDKRNGNFCINYETDITEVQDDENLKQIIKQSCYLGTSHILRSKGFNYDLDFVKSLIDNYYIFSRAEEYYIPLRPCSTVKVLVTIPSRFLYAKDKNDVYVLKPEKTESDKSFGGMPNISLENNNFFNASIDGTQDTAEITTEENNNLIKLTYKNKLDLDIHFAFIMLNLSWNFSIFAFPPGRLWRITPQETPDIIPGFGALNLPFEQNRLGTLFTQINEFLYKNISERSFYGGKEEKKQFVDIYNEEQQKAQPDSSLSISDILSINKTNALDFNGELQIFIDKNNLELKEIKFFSNNENIKLDIGADAFYKHEAVLNKTSLNYLIKIAPPDSFVDNLRFQLKNLLERKDLTEFGKFINGLLSSLDAILAVPEYLLGEKEQSLEKFLKDNHYPIIDSVFAEPVDFEACAEKFGSKWEDRVAHLTASYDPTKKIEQINKFRKDIENYKKSPASNIFIQSITDINSIQDENFKILIGKKQAKGPTKNLKLNQYLAAANMFDLQGFLKEAIKCSGAKFDPERLTNIMNDYEKFMMLTQNPDLLLLCNPLANKLQNILEQILNFSLPTMPIYDPQQSLANEIKEMIVKLINDLVVFAIRALITGSIKDCSRDNNPDFSNGDDSPKAAAKNNLANNIDRAGNNRDADSFLNDYFGLDDEMANLSSDLSPDIIKTRFKQLLKQFLEDVIACLTTKELCILLTGGRLEEDAYDVIFSILRRKYNTPENNFNLAAKLNSREEIGLFFKKIKNIYDLTICDDIASDVNPIIPKNPICDDGRKEAREKALLKSKGLSDDLIDDLLNDLKNKDEQNLRDTLDFLNKENPFDLNDIPTVLCKKGPNGEIIPPLVSLSPPVKSFNKMLSSIYNLIYNNFDEDAKTWYKNTYSVSSSAPKNNLKFDDKGQIVFDDSKREAPKDAEKDKPPAAEEKKLPSYIFKSCLEEGLITFAGQTTQVSLDGYKEQSLDLLFVSKTERDNVAKVYSNLKLFSESLLHLLDTYKLLVATNAINNFDSKPELSLFLQKDFSIFIKILGSFYANAVSVINDSDKNGMIQRVLSFEDSDYANSLFAENKPIPIVSTIMEYLVNNDNFKTNLINTIEALKLNLVNETAIAATADLNIIYKDPKTFLEESSELISTYNTFKMFNSYKKFNTIENIINQYPTYEISLKNNNGIVKDNLSTNQDELYDQNRLIIKKNGYEYINRDIDSLVDNSVLQYITNALSINSSSIKQTTKKDIFNKFINNSKRIYANSILTSSLNFSIEKKDELSKKIFDDFGFQENPTSILQPNFNGIKTLLNKQIESNILASPFLETVAFNVSPPKEQQFKDLDDESRSKKSPKPPSLKDGPPKGNIPLTQYYTLLTTQTSIQKACNIRPHYLDIDSVKSEAAKAKEESYCIEEPKNEKIKNGEEIKTSELSDIELNDTQFIMLDGTYRLYIRTHLHEIMLRAISIYGSYDPQTIRKNDLFITIMTDLLESEIRSKDNTLFLMMVGFFAKVYQFKNPELSELPSYKELFKQVVSHELRNYVLPKMSKRVYEDTNQKLSFLNPPKKASLKTLENYYEEKNKILFIKPEDKSVYIRVSGTQFLRPQNPNNSNSQNVRDSLTALKNKLTNATTDLTVKDLKYSKQEIYFQKIFESKQSFSSGESPNVIKSKIITEFANSVEYKLLFKFLFPIGDELVFRHLAAVFACGTRKNSTDAFRTAKNSIAMIAKKMTTNGVDLAPDKNNFQDMENDDSSKLFIKFIIEALITAPIKIVKGFTELTEPNIALSSKIYMLTKSFVPETPSFIIPAISFPLGIPNPAFPLGIIPWVNIPLALFYLIGGLWYEEGNGDSSKSESKDFISKMLSDAETSAEFDCSTVTNPDVIKTSIIYDGDPGYDFLSPSKDFIMASDEEISLAQQAMEARAARSKLMTDATDSPLVSLGKASISRSLGSTFIGVTDKFIGMGVETANNPSNVTTNTRNIADERKNSAKEEKQEKKTIRKPRP